MEISGLFSIDDITVPQLDKDHVFRVTKIYLACAFDQSTPAWTEITSEKRFKITKAHHESGGDIRELKGWWHIHPVMGWSGTDTATMRGRVDEVTNNDIQWAISFVVQSDGQLLCRYDQASRNTKDSFYVDNIPVEIDTGVVKEAHDNIIEVITEGKKATEAKRKAFPQADWKLPKKNKRVQSIIDYWETEDYDFWDSPQIGLSDDVAFMIDSITEESEDGHFLCTLEMDSNGDEIRVTKEDCKQCPYAIHCWG